MGGLLPISGTTPLYFGILTSDRGDVLSLLDASGAPFAAYRYDAWGRPTGAGNVGTGVWSQGTSLISAQVATDIANRQILRYASYTYDGESNLYYLSSRTYDPATRQFLSKDLSRNDGEESAYQYCRGNPVLLVDPTGYRVEIGGVNTYKTQQMVKAKKASRARVQKRRLDGGGPSKGADERTWADWNFSLPTPVRVRGVPVGVTGGLQQNMASQKLSGNPLVYLGASAPASAATTSMMKGAGEVGPGVYVESSLLAGMLGGAGGARVLKPIRVLPGALGDMMPLMLPCWEPYTQGGAGGVASAHDPAFKPTWSLSIFVMIDPAAMLGNDSGE